MFSALQANSSLAILFLTCLLNWIIILFRRKSKKEYDTNLWSLVYCGCWEVELTIINVHSLQLLWASWIMLFLLSLILKAYEFSVFCYQYDFIIFPLERQLLWEDCFSYKLRHFHYSRWIKKKQHSNAWKLM